MDNFGIYVINLEKDKQRYNSCKEQLKNYKNVNFINAIDGNKMNIDNYLKNYNLNQSLKHFPKGAIGCILSHIETWKIFLKSEYEYALILEDDIEILNDLNKAFEKVINFPIEWDLIYLYLNKLVLTPLTFLNGSFITKYNNLKKPIYPLGSVANIINKKSCKKILNLIKYNYTSFDVFLASLHINKSINCFYLDNNNESYIDLNSNFEYSNTSYRKINNKQIIYKIKFPFLYNNILNYPFLCYIINSIYLFLNRIFWTYGIYKWKWLWNLQEYLFK